MSSTDLQQAIRNSHYWAKGEVFLTSDAKRVMAASIRKPVSDDRAQEALKQMLANKEIERNTYGGYKRKSNARYWLCRRWAV